MATKQGTAKNDTLTGTNGKDQLAGLDGNDLLRGLGGADVLIGGNGIDRLEGGDGNDTLDGGPGDDDLRGGKGDDLYGVDHAKDITLTIADPGRDTVIAFINYTLGKNQEALELRGTGKLNGTGNAGNNSLRGGAGANILNGLGGDDVLNGDKGRDILRGGDGNDLYVVDHALEIESGRLDRGTDQVQSLVSYTLGPQQEELVLLGTGALSGTGNAGSNRLFGNIGANVLRGEGGNDSISGDAGGDTLFGGAGDDVIGGGAGNDSLFGDAGDDRLIGGAGLDLLHTSAGDDYYEIDNVQEIVTTEIDDGHDTVAVNFNYTLGINQEDLVLYRVTNQVETLRITGNADRNFLGGTALSGDELFGAGGNDTLNGSEGDDDLRGQAGDDTYFIDHDGDITKSEVDEGDDSVISALVNYILGPHQENLRMAIGLESLNGEGNSANNRLIGNDGANQLRGAGGNDTLFGGQGADTLFGDDGNDTLDGEKGDDILHGGAGIDSLVGGDGSDTLNGGDGDDLLNGGAGDDHLRGEDGDDTYVVDDEGDITKSDVDAGNDRVTSIISYALGAHQEDLVLSGTSNLNGTGNGGDNLLVGNSGVNELRGGAGNDELRGAGGADQLFGETGADLLNYHAAAALLDGGADTDGLYVTGTGPTTLLDLTAAGGPQITDIEDILFDAAGGTNAQQIAQTYTLRVAAADVLDLSSTDDLVKVLGEAGDKLELVGTWTEDTQLATDLEAQFTGFQFQAWTHVSGAQIATLEAVTVTFV